MCQTPKQEKMKAFESRGRSKIDPALLQDYFLRPDIDNPSLTRMMRAEDQEGQEIEIPVVSERPLTLFLNGQEIVTMMTIGDHPDFLAVGYLLNQNMLRADDHVTAIEVDDDLGLVVVRTERETNYESKLKKKVKTSGCAQGTVFGDMMEAFDEIKLPEAPFFTSWFYHLNRRINGTPSLYLKAGAIHGCVLCQKDKPLVYFEDVGRHNAVDKIAGYMFFKGIDPADKVFFTTGRLTSEMVIKTVQMRIPILISRSGFTSWGVDLARQAGLTLIGRAKGKRFVILSGKERIVRDSEPSQDGLSPRPGDDHLKAQEEATSVSPAQPPPGGRGRHESRKSDAKSEGDD